jgi:hypothetical protein
MPRRIASWIVSFTFCVITFCSLTNVPSISIAIIFIICVPHLIFIIQHHSLSIVPKNALGCDNLALDRMKKAAKNSNQAAARVRKLRRRKPWPELVKHSFDVLLPEPGNRS